MYARPRRHALASAGVAALFVLSSCGSDDHARDAAAGGRNGPKGPEFSVTSTELKSVLLSADEVAGKGYSAGPETPYLLKTPTRPGDPEYGDSYESTFFDPADCGLPVDRHAMGGPDAPRVEQLYATKKSRNGEGDDTHYGLVLASAERAVLEKQFDAYVAALQACGTFTVRDGNDSWGYKIGDVQVGRYGPMSVGFRVEYSIEGEIEGYYSAALAVAGATSVQAFTAQASGQPAEPRTILEAQLAKLAGLGG
ncbi:hypothetical protein [Yinghuangia soli]|uniref:PknH-like extracellular domain-containing protein n=1 Tax=Yinghuangia soli TaxID=2908204 RepID=A0AA41U2N1_9ACTN|nr:hypothetical protein [Yinghuangia soli]MCF2530865.1 hypothetical protein [Yinghuangia soli]